MQVEDLLERVLRPPSGGSKCWATRISGETVVFVRRVHEMLEDPDPDDDRRVNLAETARVLTEEYGVKIAQTSVRNHFTHHTVDELR